jgi:predicted metal-dependent enzyme (double-stranded beta helix superfamily)
MFDVDELVAASRAALSEAEPRLAIRDVLDRAMADRGAVLDALQPREGGLRFLHHSPELTILDLVWAPGMRLFPHDHRMWAAIGIYTGREDNTFFRRAGPDRTGLTESGGKQLDEGDVVLLGDDTIHAVTNPLGRLTGGIHIYGGDFVNTARSQWGPGPAEERPFDMDVLRSQFAEANEAWAASRPDPS